MPGSARPKRKSRTDTYMEDERGGGPTTKEKENGAPASKKRREEPNTSKSTTRSKKQKKTQKAPPEMNEDNGFTFRVRKPTRTTRSTAQSTQTAEASDEPPDPPGQHPEKRATTPPEVERPIPKKKAPKKVFNLNESSIDTATTAPNPHIPRMPKSQSNNSIISNGSGSGSDNSTRVILPVSDTPIIRRNQQFRKGQGQGNRRSSVGMRGRRASSLMDNGVIAEPHAEIAPEDFYKHIEGELLEPRRMKQLLSWCGRRALTPPDGGQPNEKDGNAHAVARIIEEEVLKDLISRGDLSNWFSREDGPASTVIKKPNPRNTDNLAKVQECEENLKRLREEREAWMSLERTPAQSSMSLSGGKADMKIFDTSLLRPEEAEFAKSHEKSQDLIGNAKQLVKHKGSDIEFQIDQLTDGIHKLHQYGEAADRLGGQILEGAESILSARETRLRHTSGTEELPIQEVLRSLSRMDR